MKKLYLVFCLVPILLLSCRSKYDTSKAIDVLPTDEITIDYRLKDLPFQIDDESSVVKTSSYLSDVIGKSGYFVKDVKYFNNNLYFVTSKKLSSLNMSENNSENSKKEEHSVTHDVSKPLLLTHKNFTLLFNKNGYFSFFDENLNDAWAGKIGMTELEFLKEKSEKSLLEILNPSQKKHTVTLSSRFVCGENICYALTTEGFLVTLDFAEKQVEMKQIVQKQDIVLDDIYQPLIIEGNIIFAIGNGEFAIYNIERSSIIGQSTFVDEESTSMFDVHLVKNIYSSGNDVIISHLNGIYAFNILQGQTLWAKNLTIEKPLISGNYMIFLDEKSQKLNCMHIQSGEVKWAERIQSSKKKSSKKKSSKNAKVTEKSTIAMINLVGAGENQYSLAVGEKKGFHILSLEDGTQTSFIKANLENVAYSFVHNGKLYYIKSGNIYKVQ